MSRTNRYAQQGAGDGGTADSEAGAAKGKEGKRKKTAKKNKMMDINSTGCTCPVCFLPLQVRCAADPILSSAPSSMCVVTRPSL